MIDDDDVMNQRLIDVMLLASWLAGWLAESR
jgi:hypothetical protein